MDVFERLGPRARICRPQKANVFERLGPVSGRIHKEKGNVFQRLGPVSGKANVFQRLGPRPSSRKVHKRLPKPKKSVLLRLGSWVADSQPREPVAVDYSDVYDDIQPPLVEKEEEAPVCKSEKEEVCKSELQNEAVVKKCEISLTSPWFSTVAQFQGHRNAVTGIAFPAGLDKIFAGSSKDKNVRVWDLKSGNSVATIDLDDEVGCMLCEGAWIFVGITNSIRVWNTQRNEQFILHGVVGQVHAIAVAGDRVFAGLEDGKILSWRFDAATNSFAPASSLLGHTSSVLSLAFGPNKLLYSGSADKTIRIWNVETAVCRQILLGHSGSVTSVIALHHNLVSCSLDGAIKAWAPASDGMFEIKDTHTEKCGSLSLCWINDSEGKPVLLCSCNDNTVRAYDIPSFSERGKICSEEVVGCIQLGPAGMFFTGDAAGQVKVWKLLAPEATVKVESF